MTHCHHPNGPASQLARGQHLGMNDADCKAFCARHGINTELIIDEHGNPQLVIDESGMRRVADLAPDPDHAHALVDQWLTEAERRDR
jgi:hypothetical protein